MSSKGELREELRKIRGIIEQETRAFASAAVPSVQADVADKIYLTEFTPLNDRSVWDGHVRSYLKPLPLDPLTGLPDSSAPGHLWDAGAVMYAAQAPELADIAQPATASELRIGSAASQRRVYYPMEPAGSGVPRNRRLLAPLAATGEIANDVREDQWRGLGIVDGSFELGDRDVFDPALLPEAQEARLILAKTFARKHAVDDDGNDIDYVLGDVFHSNPKLIGSPASFPYFAKNLFDYKSFAQKHSHRRKVLLVGANDGMLHAFDAGQFQVIQEAGGLVTTYTDGTGRELFAYVPRAAMPTITALARNADHQWGVDGTVTTADAFIDPVHSGTPSAADREWRTVAVGGLRRGGRAYFALDITQPEPLREVVTHPDTGEQVRFVPHPNALAPDPDDAPVPVCHDRLGGPEDFPCHESLRYPHPLWEFTDLSDEDANGAPDLGQTWSTPNVGAVEVWEDADADGVLDDDERMVRFVAIFGGGFDPGDGSGNWLYMVDLETGRILYKRELSGSAPAAPAAVDVDLDGFLDRVYIGTTGGYLYRVDLDPPGEMVAGRVKVGDWDARVIFDTVTLWDGNGDGDLDDPEDYEVRRPIFFPPAVIFLSRLGRHALAFGTGNRDDLWATSPEGGNRFYAFVDDSNLVPAPMTQAGFVTLPAANVDGNVLEDPDAAEGNRGWVLELDGTSNERVVTAATSIAGVTTFSTYLPDVDDSAADPDDPVLNLCAKRGDSRNYVLFTGNGNGVFVDEVGSPLRYDDVTDNFVSEPFLEQHQSGNEDAEREPELSDRLRDVMEILKQLYPKNCKFGANFRFDIKTIRSDTGIEHIAPVPVCIIESNWKEY